MKRIYATGFTAALLAMMLLATVLIAVSCTRRPLDERPANGNVKIVLDWGDYEPAQGSGFWIYDEAGNFVKEVFGDSDGWEGSLPAGKYKVVVFNTDMTGAEPVRGGSFDTDYVRAKNSETGAPGTLQDVVNVFGSSVIELNVPNTHVPVVAVAEMINFVRKVTFNVTGLETIPGISEVRVMVNGIVTTMVLNSHTDPGDPSASLDKAAIYDPVTGYYVSIATVLGTRGPNEVVIQIVYDNGDVEYTTPRDISDQLGNIPEDEGRTVDIPVALGTREIVLKVTVYTWDESGTGGGIVG